MNIIGVDACKYGWCGVGHIENKIFYGCFSSLDELITKHQNINRILIDIPIGLSSKGFKRTVDQKARTFLDTRKSSIFSPPCREALSAKNYKEALAINKSIEGKGISIQAYHISQKIREIDNWLDKNTYHIEIYEAHPELCFKTLNQNQGLAFSKHTKEGIELRQQLIFGHQKVLKAIFEKMMNTYKRSQVKPDDILDAMALFVINNSVEKLNIIKDENHIDETGKKVGIVYG